MSTSRFRFVFAMALGLLFGGAGAALATVNCVVPDQCNPVHYGCEGWCSAYDCSSDECMDQPGDYCSFCEPGPRPTE